MPLYKAGGTQINRIGVVIKNSTGEVVGVWYDERAVERLVDIFAKDTFRVEWHNVDGHELGKSMMEAVGIN
jgi:hypothetical protein